jgi:protein-S-isoprenylcysteine O-methyltransferase Ste14
MTKDAINPKRFQLPPTYFNFSWFAMFILHFTIPIYRFLYYPYNLIGFLFMLAGLWINIRASSNFKKAGTTIKPFQTSTQLVTTGLFRYSRHPMYLGMVIALLGIILILGSLSPIIILPIFIVLISRKFITPEEKMLLSTFGETYEKYKKQVRKWI